MVTFDAGIGRVTDIPWLDGRDFEAGVREVLKPLGILGVNNHIMTLRRYGQFRFPARRLPNLVANQKRPTICQISRRFGHAGQSGYTRTELHTMLAL